MRFVQLGTYPAAACVASGEGLAGPSPLLSAEVLPGLAAALIATVKAVL